MSSFRGCSFYPDPGPPWLTANALDLALLSMSSQRESEFRLVPDNLTFTRSNLLSLSVEPAVRLSWPAVAGSWIVESARGAEGPWNPVTEPVTANGGLQQITIPAQLAEVLRVFRLRYSN